MVRRATRKMRGGVASSAASKWKEVATGRVVVPVSDELSILRQVSGAQAGGRRKKGRKTRRRSKTRKSRR